MSTENQEIQGKKYRFYKVLVWALLGAILTYIVCAMSLTSDHTVDTPFYNAGDISEISIRNFRSEIIEDEGYQEKSGLIVLEQGMFYRWITLTSYSDAWNYLCVRLDDLTADSIECEITYQKLKNDEVTESVDESYTLEEGMNVLLLPEQKFDKIRIRFYGENGTTFSVGEIQFQENLPIYVNGTTIAIGVLTVVCYLVLSGIIWIIYRRSSHKRHIPCYGAISILQEFYLAIAERLAKLQSKVHINQRRRRIIRTCLFLGMLYYCMTVVFEKNYSPVFRFKGLFVILFICAIAVFSIEENPTKKNWNNPLVWGWLIVAVMMCVSDFVIPKETNYYPYVGFVLIAFIGFFIFVWNNMKNRGEIIEDFVRASHIFLWVVVTYCVLFRPHDPDVRYSGITNNPNNMAFYTVFFWAIVLGSLDYAIRVQKKKRVLLLYVIEACLVFSLAWKTQSATALITMALVGIIWLVRMIVYVFRNKRTKALIGTLICAIVLFLPIHAALSFGLLRVPEQLGTAIVYEDEVIIESTQIGTVAYAAEDESGNRLRDNRLFEKLTSSSLAEALSGRNYIYKEYLRDLNWFGHDTWPDVFGDDNPRNAHNEILNQAYRYGIFTAIPYIVMLVAVIARTWRYGRKKINFASVPFFVCLAVIVDSMGEVELNPFYWPAWFGLYLLMGCVFCEESLIEEEDDPCYNKKLDCKSDETNKTEEIELNGGEA